MVHRLCLQACDADSARFVSLVTREGNVEGCLEHIWNMSNSSISSTQLLCPSVQDLGSWRDDNSQADEALHKLDSAGISKARGAAQAALDALMLTDAPLLYSPSLVALAALRAGFRKVVA